LVVGFQIYSLLPTDGVYEDEDEDEAIGNIKVIYGPMEK